MDPATLLLIIGFVRAAIQAAPEIEEIAVEAKRFFTGLFAAGQIDQATQDRLHAHVDALSDAALAGTELPEWTVEPDPPAAVV